jgi:plasmid stabilization system protein ParE
MSYSLHPGAQSDVAEVLDFYRERAGAAVAGRFLDEFERVVALLVRQPAFGTPTSRGPEAIP